VLHQILFDLLRLLAPVMSFTADEAFGFLPHKPSESIFLCGLPQPSPAAQDEPVLETFDRLFAVRSEVQKVLEAARRDKLIGASLEAKVSLFSEGELAGFLKDHAPELSTLFIVSRVDLVSLPLAGASKAESLPLSIKVERAPGEKCPRCWTYSEAIDAARPVCLKCEEALRS
jgi:isoleucyl-tRNA synthetase